MVSDIEDNSLLLVTTEDHVDVYAGTPGKEGIDDGPSTGTALLSQPTGLAVRGRTLYFVELGGEYQGALRIVHHLDGLSELCV